MKIFENKNIKYLIIPMIILTITASITITIQTIKQYKAVKITLNEKIAEIMGKISESNPEMDSREIIEILKRLAKERNKCVIVVTHSKEVANSADIILELSDKKLKKISKIN